MLCEKDLAQQIRSCPVPRRNLELYSPEAIREFTRQRITSQMTSQRKAASHVTSLAELRGDQDCILADDDAGIPEGEPSPAWQGVHLGT